MNSNDMRERTKAFALRVIRLASELPNDRVSDILGRQVLKSGTSVGANYREALRGSSRRHFTTLSEIALREADESSYWLELLSESGVIKPNRLTDLLRESGELTAILAATVRTAKRRKE
ncbi:MAG: four helix bundle protein [Planctomycetes bacterium]|nr:four helix bundle protein [Planctomycetota bacterium]